MDDNFLQDILESINPADSGVRPRQRMPPSPHAYAIVTLVVFGSMGLLTLFIVIWNLTHPG
ncbi:MAG TPA: hypothetical protein VFR33_14380 [Candidatus Dormibacteraeota bacterium]|nr:hypothetical protein [Candidatus Dormibacteraeota bacterium]